MKKSLIFSVALATVLAAPAFAAAPKYRAPVTGNDTPYRQTMMPPANSVITEGKLVGVDPDPNIRTQLLHDPDPSGF